MCRQTAEGTETQSHPDSMSGGDAWGAQGCGVPPAGRGPERMPVLDPREPSVSCGCGKSSLAHARGSGEDQG